MNIQYKNTNIELVTTKKVIPDYTYNSGTLSSTGTTVTITGGSTSNMAVGGWIYSAVNSEIRKITGITNGTTFTIDHQFSTNLSSENFTYTPSGAYEISCLVNGNSGQAQIDNVQVNAGTTATFSKSSGLVDPVIVDGAGTSTVTVTVVT